MWHPVFFSSQRSIVPQRRYARCKGGGWGCVCRKISLLRPPPSDEPMGLRPLSFALRYSVDSAFLRWRWDVMGEEKGRVKWLSWVVDEEKKVKHEKTERRKKITTPSSTDKTLSFVVGVGGTVLKMGNVFCFELGQTLGQASVLLF